MLFIYGATLFGARRVESSIATGGFVQLVHFGKVHFLVVLETHLGEAGTLGQQERSAFAADDEHAAHTAVVHVYQPPLHIGVHAFGLAYGFVFRPSG